MLVVKIGGGGGINYDNVCEDLVRIGKNQKLVVVHGGHAKRDQLARQLGLEIPVVTSQSGVTSVYTTPELLEVFLMAYAGLINKKLVAKLQKLGLNAVGLCGVDGRLFEGRRKNAIYIRDGSKIKLLKDDLSGKVESINLKLLGLLLQHNMVPVVCPLAISFEGDIINVDGDSIACLLAKELKAEKLVFLIEAPGFLRHHQDETSVIERIPRSEIESFINFAVGRMKRKILSIQDALLSGVKEVFIADGRSEEPITKALQGAGTLFF